MQKPARSSRLLSAALFISFCTVAPPRGVPQEPSVLLNTEVLAGDAAYRQFDNNTALAAYQRAFAIDSSNYAVLWKIARAYADVGFMASDPVQTRYYRAAERGARRCVALHPDSAESHFVLALALGRVALKVGGKTKIALSKEIKAQADSTLALNPCHGGALHIIGRWHYELANLSWILKSFAKVLYGGLPPSGGNEEAKRWFEKALACDPRSPRHYLWLAKAQLELGEDELARSNLEKCLRVPPEFWDDDLNQREAQKLLKKFKG